MLEEKNIYWTYRKAHHEWQSKKFMDLSGDDIPEGMYTEARTKRGSRAKSPLWFYVKIGTEENKKNAASQIASALMAITLTPSKSLNIFFNEKLKKLIFVFDCQHLINTFSYKVVDEKYVYITTIKNLIFDLFLQTDIAAQYNIYKENKIDSNFIKINNFYPIKFTISKEISIYDQEKFFEKLHTEIAENMRLFRGVVDKLYLCHVFSKIIKAFTDYKNSEHLLFASGLLQKATKQLELPFLFTHLAIKTSLDENLQDKIIKNKNTHQKFKPILNWNCKRLCNTPCGLHHPLDALSFTNETRPHCTPQESSPPSLPEKLTGVSPRLAKVFNLSLDELPVLLFFASCLLNSHKLTIEDDTVSIFFPFLYINHNFRTIKSILSIIENTPYKIYNESKHLTKHELANSLKTHSNINFIGSDDTNTDILSLLLKRSRTSSQDIHQIKNSVSANIDRKHHGRLNCISFCTSETLIKFSKSKIFRSGMLKHFITIQPDAYPYNFSTEALKGLLNHITNNIHNIDNCNKFFEKICEDFNVNFSTSNNKTTGSPKWLLNYAKIIFILIIITIDEKNITLMHGEKSRSYYRVINDSAIFLNKRLIEFSEKSMIDFKFTILIRSMESFLSRYKHKFIYERELTRPFLGSHNKKYIHNAINMLCEKGRLIKGDGTTPLKIGRKSSQLYKIEEKISINRIECSY